jgi:ATP-dependent 26S proteasome regulatory subunit
LFPKESSKLFDIFLEYNVTHIPRGKVINIMESKELWIARVLATVGGLRPNIEQIISVIEKALFRPYLWEKAARISPKGLLIHGLSGTGKTRSIKAIAGKCYCTWKHHNSR